MKKWILTFAALLALQMGALHAQDNVLSAAQVNEGYKLLFDGTLQSFKNNFGDYIANDSSAPTMSSSWTVDAACKCIKLSSGFTTNDLRSVKKYGDFEFRLTYKIDGNQGILYRGNLAYSRMWLSAVEYAINDRTDLGRDNPSAAYDLYAPSPLKYNTFSTGLWNEVRIIAIGDSIEHWSNGFKVVGYRVHSEDFWKKYVEGKWDTEGPYTLTNLEKGKTIVGDGYIRSGYLGLQGDHGGKWQIKNMMITETPCFGPIKTDGSVCATTSMLKNDKTKKMAFTTSHNGSGKFSINFASGTVKSATIVDLSGKVISRANVSEVGHKATFGHQIKTGLYFLKLDTGSGVATQKLNIL